MLRLADGPGKSIKEEYGSMFLHPGRDNPHSQLIRDEETLAGPFVSFATQHCLSRALGA